jgi:ABC-type Fe3+ transport system permease subunit
VVERTISEEADRLSRRRARVLPVLAIFYLAQQVTFFNSPHGERLVDHFKIGAWALLSVVLLVALVTGGFWLRKPQLRAMLNDELSRAHRADALRVGFILAMLAGIILYVVGTAFPMTDREVIHLIVSVGIGAALIRFGMLERRGDTIG